MLLSLRPIIEVPQGLWGNMTLMAHVARPPRRHDRDRHRKAIDAIRRYAAHGFYDQYGYNHPENPRKGNRSRADRLIELHRVFAEFEQGVRAGRMFLSSLAARDPAAAKAGFAETLFRFDTPVKIRVPAVPHNTALAAIPMSAHPKYVRQIHWDNHIPSIHIGAAFAQLIDGNIQLQGDMPWQKICRALLFQEGNEAIPPVIVANANRLLQAAEDAHFFQKAAPSPLVLKE